MKEGMPAYRLALSNKFDPTKRKQACALKVGTSSQHTSVPIVELHRPRSNDTPSCSRKLCPCPFIPIELNVFTDSLERIRQTNRPLGVDIHSISPGAFG